MTLLRTVTIAGLALLLAPAPSAHSQARTTPYPDRTIKVVVPYSPGGGADAVTRLVSEKLAVRLGQSVVVENRAGGAANIGAAAVAKSAPDGYTLLMIDASHTINASIYKNPGYDLVKDLAPIGMMARFPYVLVVPASLPVKTTSELIAMAKEKPGALSFQSSGRGTTNHIAGAMLASGAGIDLIHVPYKGAGAAVADILEGRVQIGFYTIPPAMPHIQSGKLRPLAITDTERMPGLDLPTIAETIAGYEMVGWLALVAPAGTPRGIVDRLNETLNEVLTSEEVRSQLLKRGYREAHGSPQDLAAAIQRDVAKYRAVLGTLGLSPE